MKSSQQFKIAYVFFLCCISFYSAARTIAEVSISDANKNATTRHLARLEPDQGILFSIGQDVDSINNYAEHSNTPDLAGVVNYVGIQYLDGLLFEGNSGAGRNNIHELAEKYPNSALIIGVSMNGVISRVAAGEFNENIDILLRALGAYNRPIYLRWAYEVDGPWNGHNPNDLIRSWRYVHQRIRDLGYEKQIALVFQVATYCPVYTDFERWWPGDQFVDWVGFSYFAPQDCNWQRIHEFLRFNQRHGHKPVFINESSPQRYQISDLTYSYDPAQGTNRIQKSAQQIWDEWFIPYFNMINDPSNNIKAITYINADWDNQPRWGDFGDGYSEGYWGDSRVQVNPIIFSYWLQEINKPRYIHLSENLFERLGFKTRFNTGQ